MANGRFPWERGVAALALVALLRMPVSAAEGGQASHGQAPSTDPVNRELAEVIDLFYDIQPDAALAAARRIEARHPEHPAGPFYQSVVHYERSLFEDPPRPETFQAFDRDVERCLKVGEAALKTSPALAHYYLGACHGFRARVRVHQGRMREALADGRQTMRHVNAAVEADPESHDAYLGLGMYNYFVARLPAAAKPVAFMLTGMWPDRDKGLAQLQRAAERGTIARVESRGVLAAVYSSDWENRWDEADAILAPLMERYPRNPYFRLRRVYIAERLGRWEEAIKLADPDGAWMKALTPEVLAGTSASARYRAAEILILSGRPEEARRHLDLLREARCPSTLKSWIAVRAANLLQYEGRLKEASGLLKAVKKGRAQKAAGEFLKEPYPKGPKTVAPLRWPLSEVQH